MSINTSIMQHFGLEDLSHVPARRNNILFEWKWLLIGLWGFIDRFWQNKFPPKSRYGVQTRLRALLEPAIRHKLAFFVLKFYKFHRLLSLIKAKVVKLQTIIYYFIIFSVWGKGTLAPKDQRALFFLLNRSIHGLAAPICKHTHTWLIRFHFLLWIGTAASSPKFASVIDFKFTFVNFKCTLHPYYISAVLHLEMQFLKVIDSLWVVLSDPSDPILCSDWLFEP